ncbi:MAG TPA: type II toxin-antitoxin system RelE/ParE family toxin [Isosphaeraceae bacterium]|nr:type II toxin-antitoxin system RelE/ParE family toxin [Isosphaeraceae bacterium]
MTRYTVVWIESAQNEPAEIWRNARNRNAVTAAAHVIDVELSQDAAGKGVEISEGLRAFFAPPLRILFSVDEGDRVVEVARVGRM